MKTRETKNYAGPPPALPMPHSPIGASPQSAMPMPARMPEAESPIVDSAANRGAPGGEETRAIAMSDYPSGRGGMQRVSVMPARQAEHGTEREGTPIGARPPASRMPM